MDIFNPATAFDSPESELIALGVLLNSQRKYDESIACFSKALIIQQKKLGKNHPDIAETYTHIGTASFMKGDYDKASEFALKTLAIRRATLGEVHAKTAMAYLNLGKSSKDINEKISLLTKAVTIYETIWKTTKPGEMHEITGYTAMAMSELGRAHLRNGNTLKAAELSMKCLGIAQAVFDVASSSSALAPGHVSSAVLNHWPRVTSHEREQAFFTYSCNTAIHVSCDTLGSIHQDKGDFVQAIEYYSKGLTSQLALTGENDVDAATGYTNLAFLYLQPGSQHNDDKAIELHTKALSIRQAISGENHLTTADYYANLGMAYVNKKNYVKAIELKTKSLNIIRKLLGEMHSRTAVAYVGLAVTYLKNNIISDGVAAGLLEKAVKIATVTLGPKHPETQIYKKLLAETRIRSRHNVTVKQLPSDSAATAQSLSPEHASAADTSLTASLASVCDYCGGSGKMLFCSRCLLKQYCGPSCQRQHWPAHKAACKPCKPAMT